MATTKLTLSVDTDTVEWAKKYAQEKRISLSRLFQNHLKDIAAKESQPDPLLEKLKNMQIPEHIKALSGVLEGKYPKDMDYKDMKYEYLKDRYGL